MVRNKFRRILHNVRAFGAEAARQGLEGPLYASGLWLYKRVVGVVSISNKKASLLAKGQKEIWRIIDSISPADKVIWVHAASLGEFEQGRPIIEKIRDTHPEYKILLTFFSPSGYEVRKNYKGADWVCYLPFDTPVASARFVERVRPEKAIFIKYEIWRNYLRQLWKHQIPVYLVSACFRPDQVFFKKSGSWYRAWLHYFTHIFVQDERSRDLLQDIGYLNVTVAGDSRFDRVADIAASHKDIPIIEQFIGERKPDSFVFMVGSSWPEDEDIYFDWVNKHPEVKVIIAPHEFDESRLKNLKDKFKGDLVLMSEADKGTPVDNARVLIIDCFGLLSSAYSYCDVAYIGGGFGVSIHNINEAAVYGVPVIFGPENSKFIEAQMMKELGCGIEVHNKEDFEAKITRLLEDTEFRKLLGRKSSEYISSNLGATDKIMRKIF